MGVGEEYALRKGEVAWFELNTSSVAETARPLQISLSTETLVGRRGHVTMLVYASIFVLQL